MADKYFSKGLTLQVSISSVYTTVGSIISLNGPDSEVQFWTGQTLDDGVAVQDGLLTGHTTPGSVNFQLYYDPADVVHILLAGDVEDGGVYRDFKTIMPDDDDSEATYSGSISKWTPSGQVGNGFIADGAIKLNDVATMPA